MSWREVRFPVDVREHNRLVNVYSREPEARSIGSPFRVKEYVEARIKGKTPEQALEIVKRKKA